jgi:FkbM family methyltransferase
MVTIKRWKHSRLRSWADIAVYPLAYVINRPALAWLGRLLHEFALRCNGIGAGRTGHSGLTLAEENLLRAVAHRIGDGLVVDVGANNGSFSRHMRALAPRARIVAFEPHPRTYQLLAEAARDHRFDAVQMAVSDQAGTTTLHDFADADGSTQASLAQEAVAFFDAPAIVAHSVQCTTLDAQADIAGWERIAYLKIDTEGFDLAVLHGAARLIGERRIDMIQFEFIAANVARRIFMRDFFVALPGYRLFRLCQNGALLPLAPYQVKSMEIFHTQNIVATPG